MSHPAVSGSVGAVLVVGAGISGMQSSLDLAEAGFKVYLLESAPAIGGTMAMLDKTFPTNDCAMCIVSPKLVDTARHPNIEVITNANLLALEGSPGNFKARVMKKARFVDVGKCTGCGDCAAVCPVEIPNSFDSGIGKRKAIFKLYPQATPVAFSIEKKGLPPCRNACPAGVNVQGYIQLIGQGKFAEAWRLIYRDNPFPGVCGRICTHPCQEACHRGEIDAPLNIMRLKRAAADYTYSRIEEIILPEMPFPGNHRVAVAGSGPAGLSAAYQLVKLGCRVTVFESMPVAGGMLRLGIPRYRLPGEVVDLEIGLLEKVGVEIRLNTPLGPGRTIGDLFSQGFEAVFLSTGLHLPVKLRVPGEELPGVFYAVDFLKKINLGEPVTLSGRVVVVGGGNVALDAARTALRVGADRVTVIALENRNEMPASAGEVALSLEEGVIILNGLGVKSIAGPGRVKAVQTLLVSSVFDQQGRFNPRYSGDGGEIPADYVIIAIGQTGGLDFVDESYRTALCPGNRLVVDQDTLATPVPGVFAGGDLATGPATVVSAIAAGKRAAESIHRFITGRDPREGREFSVPREKLAGPGRPVPESSAPPPDPKYLPPSERLSGFVEESLALTPDEAVRESGRCLNCGGCSECLQCASACMPGAIDHGMKDEVVELNVGAVILSPGLVPFDGERLYNYGLGRYPNVVSSLSFERMLSASGPFQGHLVRPYDGKEPGKIAWIQCVGSRNERIDRGYCSSVCCMYAIKEAVIAKEHCPGGLETTIFYMDMRTHGKDFERYFERARNEYGVRFIRSRVYGVEELPGPDRNLKIRYALENGTVKEETFDLVVLSLGLQPSAETLELASAAGIEFDSHGFCPGTELFPGTTSRPGVFVSGPLSGPKDIPETVVDASAAASMASQLLNEARHSLTSKKTYPPEKNLAGVPPRLGVFVCNCGINIGGVVRVSEVAEYARQLKDVAHVEEFLFTCSQDSIKKIQEIITRHNINRVVVASCTPRTHGPLFQASIREVGINPYLYEQVNIREHCSWVHRDCPDLATAKAKKLVAMGVAKARLLKPVMTTSIPVSKRALVLGGGAAGMTAALSLANQGFRTSLVEKEGVLGGNLNNLRYAVSGARTEEILADLAGRVKSSPLIDIYLNSTVHSVEGYPGKYNTVIDTPGGKVEINHGAAVIATGASAVKTSEYLYGDHRAVVTQTELEDMISNQKIDHLKQVVMIQCVGSRQENRPYCSRVCCTQAVKNSLLIKESRPDCNIFILYRDMRTFGLNESYYTEARRKGVIFARYRPERRPVAAPAGDTVEVRFEDLILQREIVLKADLLVLSVGIEGGLQNAEISRLFRVPLNSDGFFSEAHAKLRPVDFSGDGLYLAGLAHGPKLLKEAIAAGNAAAVRAATLLSKDYLESLPNTVSVNPRLCQGCGICVKTCQYQARELDPVTRLAKVIDVICRGCGACAAACPSGATGHKTFEKAQILSSLSSL